MNKAITSTLPMVLLTALILLLISSCYGLYEPDPAVPLIADVAVTGDTASELKLSVSWQGVQDAGGYNIYRSENGGPFLYIGSTAPGQSTFIDAGEELELGASYRYRVSAYGLWHTKESELSPASSPVDYFLQPQWETILARTADSPVAVKIAATPQGTLFFLYADSAGALHAGRIVEEEDPEDEDETIFTVQDMPAAIASAVDPADPDFDIIVSGGALYVGYADYESGSPDSGKLTVREITVESDEDDDELLIWEERLIGSRWFSEYPVSSVSLAAEGFGTGTTLYAGYIRETAAVDTVLAVRSKLLSTTSGSGWGDLSPEKSAYPSDTPEYARILLEDQSLAIAYSSAVDGLHMLSRISSGAGFEWVATDTALPAVDPLQEHFSIAVNAVSLSVFGFETGDTWNLQLRRDDAWRKISDDTGFSTLSAGIVAPFSAAASTTRSYLLADNGNGPAVLMYDFDISKWFSYGSPGTAVPFSSPSLKVSGNTLYTAWIGDGNLSIAAGR